MSWTTREHCTQQVGRAVESPHNVVKPTSLKSRIPFSGCHNFRQFTQPLCASVSPGIQYNRSTCFMWLMWETNELTHIYGTYRAWHIRSTKKCDSVLSSDQTLAKAPLAKIPSEPVLWPPKQGRLYNKTENTSYICTVSGNLPAIYLLITRGKHFSLGGET